VTVRATAGVVDVWRAELTASADGLDEMLSADEHERARRLHSERARQLWISSRGVLRALLGRYLERDPRTLRFARGAHGKPLLEAEPAASSADLSFNLAHSGELALYAVTAGRSVGIDVQVARRELDEVAVAARVLGDDQARHLASLDHDARAREFLRAWVANEAQVKCRGTGLAAAQRDPSDSSDLWTAELDVGPRAGAAVTSEGGRCELRCWAWRT
jgi:4'-phosphopantetheinyl transferase